MSRRQLLWAICKQIGPENPRLALLGAELARLQTWQLEWLYHRGMPVCRRHRCLMPDRKHCRICDRERARRHRLLGRSLDARAERLWNQRYAVQEAAYYGRTA